MASLKLNKCKIRAGDKITALYIGNPITENYPTDNWYNLLTLSNNLTICTCKTPATNGVLLENSNGGGEVKDLDIANLEDFDTKRPDRIYLGQYGNRQNQDNIKSQKDCIIYFTKPLTVTLALTCNSHFDEDFQGIVAFTNTGRVNTGAFDPASDTPAGQKSLTDFIRDSIIEADLNARYSRVASEDLTGAFSNLSRLYSGKFHFLRPSFLWGSAINATGLFYLSDIEEIDYSGNLDNMFHHAGSVSMEEAFGYCGRLKRISAEYSLTDVTNLHNCFNHCVALKTIKLKNFPVSFDISASTAFEEADLVEIIGNLMDLTGEPSQTLTMGATNLAKLTDAEKAVAINKNWVLA